MRRWVLALAVLLPTVAQAQNGLAALRRGHDALVRHDLRGAMASFREAAGDRLPGIRAAGERELGIIAWRLRGRRAEAAQHFTRALAIGIDSAMTLVERARFQTSQGRYGAAAADAVLALRRLRIDDEFGRAARVGADALVERWLRERVDGRRDSLGPPIPPEHVAELRAALEQRVRRYPGRTADAHALLHLGLVDGVLSYEAWRGVFLVEALHADTGRLAAIGSRLSAAAGRWSAGVPGDAGDQIIAALAASRLYEAAAIVATHPRTPQAVRERADVREVVAYAAFTRALRRDVEAHYRLALVRAVDPDDIRRIVTRHTRALWPRLHRNGGGATPTYTPAAALREIARRFAGIISYGEAVGIRDLHYAHAVASAERTVSFGSSRVTVHHVIADATVNNGFQSWMSDRDGQRAGLASGDSIVQVRAMFTEYPFLLWQLETDSLQRAYERARIAADSAADWTIARRDSAAFLPGVAGRLIRDARAQLMESLRGTDGTVSQTAFVSGLAAALREGSIIAHEARHVLNARLRLSRVEDEFRAKISEVRHSPLPRLALGSIVHPNIGDATTHGQANRRLILGIIRWMRSNGDAIRGYDASRPALPQLPLLDDDQIRAAFAAMDTL